MRALLAGDKKTPQYAQLQDASHATIPASSVAPGKAAAVSAEFRATNGGARCVAKEREAEHKADVPASLITR